MRCSQTAPWGRPFPVVLCTVLAILLFSFAATAATAASSAAHCSNETEFYCVPGGRDYRGHLSTTSSGLTCQAWSSQSPWPHTETYPDLAAGIGDHNYCRYMDALQTVGCYTTDPNVQVDTCDIGEICECYFPDKTITFTPHSGSLLVADGSSNFVELQCFPSPCDLYYTINGDTPTIQTAIPYNGLGVMLTESAMVKALAVYGDGTLQRFATYTVELPYTPDPSIAFQPSSDVVYTGPVFAHLDGLQDADEVLLFVGDAAPITYVNGDSFWVSNTSEVTAVINGTRVVKTVYVIQAAAPTFAVYPVSGSFLGGIRVVVYAEGKQALYVSVNGAAEEKLSSSTFVVSNVGLSVVSIRVVYLGGVVSQSVHRYEILEPTLPAIIPDGALFHRAVTVTCEDPLGKQLAVQSLSHAGNTAHDEDAEVEGAYELALTQPGLYTVNCSYVDNLGVAHTSTRLVTLEALPLPTPVPTPACGTAFPNTPLFLLADVLPAADGLSAVDTEYALSILTDLSSARVQFVEKVNETAFAYALVPSVPSGTVAVSFQSASSDVMEQSSEVRLCTYDIHALADRRTPLHVARPVCPTFEDTAGGVVPDECKQEIAFQLATCLHFYTTDLLELHTYGPLLTVRVNQLPLALEETLYQRIHTCLAGSANTSASVAVTDVQGEVEDTIQLATGWELLDGISVLVQHAPSTPLQQTISEASFLVRVSGLNVANGSYHFVNTKHTCFDLGIPAGSDLFPEELHPSESAYVSSVDKSGAALVAFLIDAPGTYKLCARFGSALYEVTSVAPLTVVPRPWSTIAPVREDMCGGLVDTAFASAPLTVSFEAGPPVLAPLLMDYWYSVDGDAVWQSKALGYSVSLAAVESFASPSRVVTASLGALSGAQSTCVFYAPAVNPAVTRTGISYRFYTKPVQSAVAHQNTTRDLFVVLNGSFQSTELMRLSLASPSWTDALDRNESDAVWTPRGSTALTTDGAVNYSLAIPYRVVRVETSTTDSVWRVVAELDGVAVTVPPAQVALSDLSAGMQSSTACTSGYQYGEACVCIGSQNKTAYICGKTITPPPDVPDTSSFERIMMLLLYFVCIALIVAYIVVSIQRGEHQPQVAEDITIDAEEPSQTSATRVAPAEGDVPSQPRRSPHSDGPEDVAEERDDQEGSERSRSGSDTVEVNPSNWF